MRTAVGAVCCGPERIETAHPLSQLQEGYCAEAAQRADHKSAAGYKRPHQLKQPETPGAWQVLLQLILEDGAEEVLIMPTAEDGVFLRGLIHDVEGLYWDTEHKVHIFNNI